MTTRNQLQGKVALVTGASGGIGSTIATALAAEGATLALAYGPRPEQAKDEMARLGIEPRTPRFSDGRENPWLTTDLQDFFW